MMSGTTDYGSIATIVTTATRLPAIGRLADRTGFKPEPEATGFSRWIIHGIRTRRNRGQRWSLVQAVAGRCSDARQETTFG